MTQTDSRVSIASGVETTSLPFASVQASPRVADLAPSGTGGPQGTDDRLALATQEGVSHHALQADAGRSGGGDDALGVDAAASSFALGDAFSSGALLEAALASVKNKIYITSFILLFVS